MNKYEKEEIASLPEKYHPMGAWGYWGWNFLFNLPVIGFIILIVTALGSSNINRRSYARSYFCNLLIALLVIVAIAVLFVVMYNTGVFDPLIEMLMEMANSGGEA